MNRIVLLFLFSLTSRVYGACDLTSPTVRVMVENELRTKIKGDLQKAFWMNVFKSDVYSVFVVQYKTAAKGAAQEQMATRLVTVSCSPAGTPIIDADAEWSTSFDGLQPID